MAFHRSELKTAPADLPCDLNGDVPEPGDDWSDMAWAADDARRFSEHPKLWTQFVEKAVKMTTEARAQG